MKKYVEYSEEIAKDICMQISTSTKGIRKLCEENKHWPDRANIYRWCSEREEFRDRYVKAKAFQVDWLAEEALEVAYDKSGDKIENEKGVYVSNSANVNRARLQVDTLKWIAAKLAPKIYGDNVKRENTEAEKSLIEKVIDKL